MIRLIQASDIRPRSGDLIYVSQDFAFQTTPYPYGWTTSVLVNQLELLIEEDTNVILAVYGYCPYHSWISRSLAIPPSQPNGLKVETDTPLGMGVALRLNDERWPAYVDYTTGCVVIGSPEVASGMISIAFAPGATAILNDGRLFSLWLRPLSLVIPT
jgi:hypothetical protein